MPAAVPDVARDHAAGHGYGYGDEDGTVAKDLVRFGVQFPDGGKVTNLDRGQEWPDATEPMHGMSGRGGSSSDSEAEQDFWIWPVPESGDIALVCEWPRYGIGESRLDDQRRRAARRLGPGAAGLAAGSASS